MRLYLLAFPLIWISGMMNLIEKQDFMFQINSNNVVCLITLILPSLILQIINNTELVNWNALRIISIVVLSIKCIVSFAEVYLILTKRTKESNVITEEPALKVGCVKLERS
jgi:hypothetical protein